MKIAGAKSVAKWRLKAPTCSAASYLNDAPRVVIIGRGKAVVQFKSFSLRGFVAWVMWAVVHVLFLTGFRNRLGILIQWGWMYFFYERSVRLLTGSDAIITRLIAPNDRRLSSANLYCPICFGILFEWNR